MQPNRPTQMPLPSTPDEDETARYGITRETVEYFRLGNFRYTKLEDAIAEALRRNAGVQA
ncbi:hypothetical protein [Nisaea sediminum]|uniref:hypothetical protein n=1 Tax=Nisaea sediminum TaxID=2775867 RepID=UPI0018660D62|nr:hypothetical protein [Nisaea sediminum]